MGRVLAGAVLVVVMVALLSVAGRAARGVDTAPPAASSRELIVFEADNCIYCDVFRRDVLPNYLNSKRAEEVPIRFVNVSRSGAVERSLSSPLGLVPTVVFMEDGHEIGRIAGYTGPENFFRVANHLLGR